MAQWQYNLELKDIREKYDKDEDMKAMCEAHMERITDLIRKLRSDLRGRIHRSMADELEYNILPLFEEIAENDGNVDDYDYALESLYDWADTPLDDNPIGGKKMCWVNTL